MIKIKLYGTLSDYGGPRLFSAEAKNVRMALNQATAMGVDKTLLSGALIFVNNRQLSGVMRLSRRLNDGDELALLSPAGGG